VYCVRHAAVGGNNRVRGGRLARGGNGGGGGRHDRAQRRTGPGRRGRLRGHRRRPSRWDRRILTTIKPLGTAGCGTSYGTDPDGDNVIAGSAAGAYASGTAEVDEPGCYLLCAWVQDSSVDASAFARTSAGSPAPPSSTAASM